MECGMTNIIDGAEVVGRILSLMEAAVHVGMQAKAQSTANQEDLRIQSIRTGERLVGFRHSEWKQGGAFRYPIDY
jgi:hypothetical protein